MHKRIIGVMAAVPLVLGGAAGPVAAEVNAVTPSTNDANKAAGDAFFEAVAATDAVTLTFTTGDPYLACFEYRADGAAATSATANPNPLVTDGLWDYSCVDAAGVATATVTVPAEEYVEVRMVFGAESDERFDWTKVAVLAPVAEVPVTPTRPDTVAECKNGGWVALDYTNQGRCVSEVRKHLNEERRAAKKAALAEKKAAKQAAEAAAGKAAKGAKNAKNAKNAKGAKGAGKNT